MFNYEGRYRELRSAGFPGWAGHGFERGLKRLTESLDRLRQDHVLPPPPARVLELGCGNGAASLLLAQTGYETHGIDVSETAILWAKERFATARLTGFFHQGDVCDMHQIADESFDVVIDGACLHCLIGHDRAKGLAEVRRTLRNQGIFVVSSMCGVPKSDEAQAAFDPDNNWLMHDGVPYRTLKSLAALETEIADAGFSIVDTRVQTNPWWDHATIVCGLMPVLE